ncbi:pollen Ole e 1 allergen and extensin family protein [Artemisia annua]|uniref:Pollen Ole e 1 allergen and extensin family protein n=1 Tax=Artemisia annua TaxID=35608 RepID=A0A2U1NI15_ARTAN|nr:pollen Ole e 1 allergen and extensin family protein [Artemisia annua]PWA37793.1 pollen Ole e 1 allergen and extensin family protein [Artemisia annua]PWA62009.1 pollen Ole e 1 allergen and extensin family protein [Artemisia annua]PWA73162.1 pollen Ole e 1 allergen and extensin family protein [Artemisia annua]
MAMKSIVLVSLLVVVFASSQAEAQVPSVSGSLININGTIFCSLNGNIVPNAVTPTPAFANALVQVTCGGNVVASTITNAAGIFNIFLNPLQFLLSSVLSSCQVVVATPLASCNASLPAVGLLQAPLQLAGTTVLGLLNVVNLVPALFQIIQV